MIAKIINNVDAENEMIEIIKSLLRTLITLSWDKINKIENGNNIKEDNHPKIIFNKKTLFLYALTVSK